jgi:hypothetical protein
VKTTLFTLAVAIGALTTAASGCVSDESMGDSAPESASKSFEDGIATSIATDHGDIASTFVATNGKLLVSASYWHDRHAVDFEIAARSGEPTSGTLLLEPAGVDAQNDLVHDLWAEHNPQVGFQQECESHLVENNEACISGVTLCYRYDGGLVSCDAYSYGNCQTYYPCPPLS